MKCSNCGVELPEGSKFCSECGTEQDLSFFCMKCGTKIEYGEKFCPNCGESFEERKITASDIKTFVIGTEEERRKRAEAIKGQVNKAGEAIKNQKKKWDEEQIRREAEAQVKREAEEKARQEAIEKARLELEEKMKNGEVVIQVDNVESNTENTANNQPVNNGIPIRDYDPSKDYNPIGMWGYFLYGIIFAIPVVGWIIALIFALGGTNNIHLRNYARSMFCSAIITFIIAVWTIGSTIADLKQKIESLEEYSSDMRNELEILDEDYFW